MSKADLFVFTVREASSAPSLISKIFLVLYIM